MFVLKQACPDHDAIDAATQSYEQVIAQERAAGGAAADHFAAAGSNDRIWNSLQKLALKSPATFIRYFASPAIDAACEAWLGPNYQMTAQVNLVHPGGQAQQAHRDYHLGFQSADISASYPANVHHLSPLMTLQGGIAHCDIHVASGPTKLLPFSQLYKPGYAAWRRDDFRAHFEAHYVQLPLEKGDAIFFNPALFHAAGANKSADIHRMVNLLQVSSAFGRAMETVDRAAICKMVFPALREQVASGQISGGSPRGGAGLYRRRVFISGPTLTAIHPWVGWPHKPKKRSCARLWWTDGQNRRFPRGRWTHWPRGKWHKAPQCGAACSCSHRDNLQRLAPV